MFVLCVVSKDKKKGKVQNILDKETSTGGVQTEYKRIQKKTKSRWGRIFPYPSRPTLCPAQPIKWVSGLFRGGKADGARH
jgi:hypothetical protein